MRNCFILIGLLLVTPAGRYSAGDDARAPDSDLPRALGFDPESAATTATGDGHAVSFSRDIQPLLTKAGCNAGKCHGSFQGRGGLTLSLLGYDAQRDYEALFLAGRSRRVMPAAPDSSLILLKATGSIPHGGGRRLEPGSSAHRLLVQYLSEGCRPPDASDAELISIQVGQSLLEMQPAEQFTLTVTAHWSDGVSRDVTGWTLFDAREESLVSVTADGIVTAHQSGLSSITARFAGQVAAVSVVVRDGAGISLAGFNAANFIDQQAADMWQRAGVQPAVRCSDAEFLRRVSIDLIGTLPTPDEVRGFVADADLGKRNRVVEELLARPEFVDHWALRYSDLFRVHRRYVGDKGITSFGGWVRESIRENRPLDDMARDLLTAQGNLFSSGPVAYYFVDTKPEDLAETTAQVFLGVRLQCARCHHHPLEVWSQQDYYGIAAFFTRLETKDSGDEGRYGGFRGIRPVSHEVDSRRLTVAAAPALLGEEVSTEGVADVRVLLADWMTSPENPYFARNWANRYWAWLIGRGLVDPVDDLRATNPASHPELLDTLAQELIAHDFDPRHLIRLICASEVYQLASEIEPVRDIDGRLLTHRVPRRLPAEVYLDAINQACEVEESFPGIPTGTRAISLPDPSITSIFLTSFGRPLRNSPCECARVNAPDLTQTLHLLNSPELHDKVVSAEGRVAHWFANGGDRDGMIEELYLATLSRLPSDDEKQLVRELVAEAPTETDGCQDLLWALVNSAEFGFQH